MSTSYQLSKGKHGNARDGRCAMEWVAYLAGESHSDQPVCVSPVLRRFCIAFNDNLPDVERQKLRPYLARTIGTVGDGRDKERIRMCTEFLYGTALPTLLAHDGVALEQLRALPVELAFENATRLRSLRSSAKTIVCESRVRAYDRLKEAAEAAGAAWAAGVAWAAEAAWVAEAAEVAEAAGVAEVAGVAEAAWAAWAAGVAWAAEVVGVAEAAWVVGVAGVVGVAWPAEAAWAAGVAWAAEVVGVAEAAWVVGVVGVAEAAWAAEAVEAVEVAEAAGAVGAAGVAFRKRVRDAAYSRCQELSAELVPQAFELLDRMLPTEVIQLPVVEDADLVCGIAG